MIDQTIAKKATTEPRRHRGLGELEGALELDDPALMPDFPHRELTASIIAAAIEVHRHLGPGLLESAYEPALMHELTLRSIPFQRQLVVPALYKGVRLPADYRIDLLVRDDVIVELKAVEKLTNVHRAQMLTYLRLTGKRVGLLINFNEAILTQGVRRLVL